MQAVILAGGLGTRLAPFTESKPKPMYPVQGKPFIHYLIEQVKGFGITNVVILLGYLPHIIENELGNGKEYGVNIRYDVTPVEYDTGARLRHAYGLLEDSFLLMYCDNYCPIDFARLLESFNRNHALIQLTAYANRDGYTKNNLHISDDGKVLLYDKKRLSENLAGVDIGYALMRKEVFCFLPDGNNNFEAAVYPHVAECGKMYATITEHRYYSIGSWARIKLTEQFFRHRKAVFLDRDGTINVRPPKACYVEKTEDFVWLPGAIEAVRLLKENGYLLILISNQPGIARGNLTEDMLAAIHTKMQADLSAVGAGMDAIYYCPHNWDEGCFCRKPQPGMLYQAQRDLSLDIPDDCILIGDDERDLEAAKRAACPSILVSADYSFLTAAKDIIAKKFIL